VAAYDLEVVRNETVDLPLLERQEPMRKSATLPE
jgi:hypothetical protein